MTPEERMPQLVPAMFRLRDLPASVRLVVSVFIALIGVGFLFAQANIYHRHHLADGKVGLTFDDLRIIYHGIEVPADETGSPVATSRMLDMVRPGGDMRKNLEQGGLPEITSLVAWLESGAPESTFDSPPAGEPSGVAPRRVIARRCLRCHNAEDGEKADTPYGPDIFEVDYQLVALMARPQLSESADADAKPGVRMIGPQTIAHLVLITHVHMLSIPVFTLIVYVLFLTADFPVRLGRLVGPVPMLALVFDFASWWLARFSEGFLIMLMVAGGAYAVSLAIQLLAILHSAWLAPPGGSSPMAAR